MGAASLFRKCFSRFDEDGPADKPAQGGAQLLFA